MQRPHYDSVRIWPQGLSFRLNRGDGKAACFITRAALIFLAGHFLLPRDYEPVLDTYSDHVLDVAHRRWQETGRGGDRVVLTAHDLATYDRDPGLSNETPAPSLTGSANH